ncbi:hypothetical protein ABZ916_08525 [Streptomyces sp. NPDC046853]|uniref:hypothetical protein n=1 Tax=Streptomyces sp. NPDC046853 TaxID=3154920 RepID=UPI00341092EB
MPLVLARTIRTCHAMPSQWDAWTTEGQYLYLRYRHGVGSVETYPDPDPATWDEGALITEWDDATGRGKITLADFLAAAGLRLAPDAVVVGEPAGRAAADGG